jgi:ribosome maturation factor RimP
MIDKQILEAHLKEVLHGTEIFPVDVRVDKSNRIIVHVDSVKGITIEECAVINQALEERLNRDREDFSLEVSSPGLDAPFKVPEQYMKNLGKRVSVQCMDGERLTGILKSSGSEGIQLELPAEGKDGEARSLDLKFTEIKSTKVILQF